MKKKWIALESGDLIDVIAPGMAFDQQQFKAAEKIIQQWGFHLNVPKNILGKAVICSNSREQREHFLKQALESDSKVIWAARGGFGSLHLVEALKKIKPKRNKLLIGFSDIVTLHQVVNQQWGWPSLHGPHIDRLAALNSTRLKELLQILIGHKTQLTYKLKPMNSFATKKQKISAPIVGGNMVTIQSTVGTSFQLPTRGKILFFEEIGERGYKIDRMLEHFSQLGFFKSAKAVIFGPMTGGYEPDGSQSTQKVLVEFAQRQKIPVFQGLSSGHIPNSLSLPFNTSSLLQVEAQKVTLKVETGVSF